MLLTVIMPVYNASNYLAEAIESILNQTYNEYNFIILNDKSTDNSLEIINDYAKKDKRITVYDFNENKGPAFLRNFAIEKASTKYIALMDADDISLPERFEQQVKFLERNSSYGLCGTWFTIFGNNIETETIKHFEDHDELKANFLKEFYVGNPTIVFKKEIIQGNKFDSSFHPMDDYELWSRIIFNTKFYNIQKSLLNYRWHEKNISHSTNANLSLIHKKIRFNQLKHLGIFGDLEVNSNYLKAIKFENKQLAENIYSTIEAGLLLIDRNNEKKIYNPIYFDEIIKKNLTLTIINAKTFNPSFFFKIYRDYKNIYNNFSKKEKTKFVKRCLLFKKK